MATLEVTKKVSYIGVWLENVFSNELMLNVAGYASAEKGKLVKVTLNSSGLRIKRTKLFQDKAEFYQFSLVRAAMRNPYMNSCVMFVLADRVKKYRVVAVRCGSEADAIHMTSIFTQIQGHAKFSNTEMKKSGNGNWTLSGRSTINANRHLAEVFNEQKESHLSNGSAVIVNGNGHHPDPSVALHSSFVKVTGDPDEDVMTSMITLGSTKHVDNDNGEDYVIETEIESEPGLSNGVDINGNDKEPVIETTVEDDITEELTKITVIDDDSQMSTRFHSNGQVTRSVDTQPIILRAPAQNYQGRVLVPRGSDHDHRRVSSSFILPNRLSYRQMPTKEEIERRSSLRVQFDNESIKSSSSSKKFRSKKLKLYPMDYSGKTTIERPIEHTYGSNYGTSYGKPVVLRRQASAPVALRRRPASIHVVGKKELAVFHQQGGSVDDVAL